MTLSSGERSRLKGLFQRSSEDIGVTSDPTAAASPPPEEDKSSTINRPASIGLPLSFATRRRTARASSVRPLAARNLALSGSHWILKKEQIKAVFFLSYLN